MANHDAASARGIVKRIVVTGTLVLDTPAHLGNGDHDGTEMILLLDELTQRPLLTGASIAGALRHHLNTIEAGYRATEQKRGIVEKLFGTALDTDNGVTSGNESRVIVDDALGIGTMVTRDGVTIDPETGTAEDQKLFSVQVWERGTIFPIRAELVLYTHDHVDQKTLVGAFIEALSGLDRNGEISIGARKHRGYGACHVDDWRVQTFDMQTVEGLLAWLRLSSGDEFAGNSESELTNFFTDAHYVPMVDSRVSVMINADFTLLETLLIRTENDTVDAAHLIYSDGTPVISGTSVAGVLRTRALKIAKTLNSSRAESLIKDMFGSDGDDQSPQPRASRLIVHEHAIAGAPDKMLGNIQNRVKIDRFTGGAYETALIDQQPVFAMDDTQIKISMMLRQPDESVEIQAQVGLMLLLLKDLWTSDLPIGGERSIGRGRLQGRKAKITVKEADKNAEPLELIEPFDRTTMQTLEAYVEYFVEWAEGE